MLSISYLVIQYYLLRTSLLIVLCTEPTLVNEFRFFMSVEEKQVSLIYITIGVGLLRGSLGCSRNAYNEATKSKLGETKKYLSE